MPANREETRIPDVLDASRCAAERGADGPAVRPYPGQGPEAGLMLEVETPHETCARGAVFTPLQSPTQRGLWISKRRCAPFRTTRPARAMI